ncbi:MAG: thymidine phosphorylase [Microbacterium sp.]
MPEDAPLDGRRVHARAYVADLQMAAFAMAVLLNGMTRDEIRVMTDAMIASGERMSFAGLGKPTVDKHSTGGVATRSPCRSRRSWRRSASPCRSSRGAASATSGGTLDKLESTGWRAALSNDEITAQLRGVGAVICAAGTGLAPADKRLYALRDVTGTVEAIPLIASSIMSKKIAEGTDALVLDVKPGGGAFMRDVDMARELARTMVALGTDSGVATTALLTDMNTPLSLRDRQRQRGARESVEVPPAAALPTSSSSPSRLPARCWPSPVSPTPTSRRRCGTGRRWMPGAR